MSETKEQNLHSEKPIEHPQDKPNTEIRPPDFVIKREGLIPKQDKFLDDQLKKIIEDMDDK